MRKVFGQYMKIPQYSQKYPLIRGICISYNRSQFLFKVVNVLRLLF